MSWRLCRRWTQPVGIYVAREQPAAARAAGPGIQLPRPRSGACGTAHSRTPVSDCLRCPPHRPRSRDRLREHLERSERAKNALQRRLRARVTRVDVGEAECDNRRTPPPEAHEPARGRVPKYVKIGGTTPLSLQRRRFSADFAESIVGQTSGAPTQRCRLKGQKAVRSPDPLEGSPARQSSGQRAAGRGPGLVRLGG